jgi:hypothetical protein
MPVAMLIAAPPECARSRAQRHGPRFGAGREGSQVPSLLLAAVLSVTLLPAPDGRAQSSAQKKAESKESGPPVFVVTPPPAVDPSAKPATTPPPETLPSEQKLYGQTAPLIATEQAQAVVDKFKEAYPKLGSPRLLIHVNRDVAAADKSNSPKPASTAAKTGDLPLADRQTMRDIERLFGRPLRSAGASLADQNAANAILGDKSIHSIEGNSAAAIEKRDALAQITDTVIEVLISPKNVTVSEISGERAYSVPDIQATVVRLSDFKILGQATSNDFLGRILALRRFDANEITEATALALMEDMATNAR